MRINPFKMSMKPSGWSSADPESKKYAYEVHMINPNNFNSSDLPKTEIAEFVHCGEDLKRKQFFDISGETMIILEETAESHGKSGMESIIEIIEKQDSDSTFDDNVFEGDENAGASGTIRLSYDVKCDDLTNECEGIIRIYIAKNVTIDGKAYSEGEIMRCYPIDPATHLRYPNRWFQAKVFFPIGLFAPSMIGKTTAMVSMFAAERNAEWPSDWLIRNAMEQNDCIKMDFKKKIDALVYERKCPDYTQTEFQVPPVFFTSYITLDGKEVEAIIGIYDFSGEALSKQAAGNELVSLFPLMKGIIFMVSPSAVRWYDAKKDKVNAESVSESRKESKVEILSLKEQAEFQKKNKDKILNGHENESLIKDNRTANNPETGITVMHETMCGLMGNPRRLYNTHLAFVISQCDRLEGQKCLGKEYESLFVRDSDSKQKEIYNDEGLFEHIRELEEMFITRNVLNMAAKQKFEYANNGHVSYHVVSATGCNTIDPDNKKDKYGTLIRPLDPIRIREPLIVCINEMKKNEFYYKE